MIQEVTDRILIEAEFFKPLCHRFCCAPWNMKQRRLLGEEIGDLKLG
eukprot:CAMPEP_0204118092 /NCGR_PEP_ID=MMETSP0361-20130328/6348_1 /ASSEMBLY_ACC=CAM_ASM_000343 /TAXON_ID=268821 /ORGANISM="Scrippsiella Hangoei, Strain SHTV-5" /LENGTH=46 /DNA_ID= /DNA_START= /DNA_END= /DNA_ORIENTATION=